MDTCNVAGSLHEKRKKKEGFQVVYLGFRCKGKHNNGNPIDIEESGFFSVGN